MSVERAPGTLRTLSDDALGSVAVSLAVKEIEWTPDVAPAVLDRIARDAVTYPEQFDRRPPPPTAVRRGGRGGRTRRRTLGRLAVFGVLLAIVALAVVVAANAGGGRAASEPGALAIELEVAAEGFDEPLFVTGAGDGSGLYVVEQPGRIMRVADGRPADEPFLDIRDAVRAGGERGLLGLAFHPAYPDDARIFIDYTRARDGATVVSELAVVDGTADRSSERQLLVIEQPFGNHNGGMLAFDADGFLLIGTGDGGSGGDPLGHAQAPDSLLGKLLRIDVDAGDPYGIPPDNGFAASDAHRPEIHAKGLRNPWRFSVDPDGGHVYIGDVGQNRWEEIDVLPGGAGGANLGWNDVEGPECFQPGCDPSAYLGPVMAYGHDRGCSVVGGYAYRGTEQPELAGTYLFGDLCSDTIYGAPASEMLAGPTDAKELGRMDGTLVSFGTDDAGELYAVDQQGRIFGIRAVTTG